MSRKIRRMSGHFDVFWRLSMVCLVWRFCDVFGRFEPGCVPGCVHSVLFFDQTISVLSPLFFEKQTFSQFCFIHFNQNHAVLRLQIPRRTSDPMRKSRESQTWDHSNLSFWALDICRPGNLVLMSNQDKGPGTKTQKHKTAKPFKSVQITSIQCIHTYQWKKTRSQRCSHTLDFQGRFKGSKVQGPVDGGIEQTAKMISSRLNN